MEWLKPMCCGAARRSNPLEAALKQQRSKRQGPEESSEERSGSEDWDPAAAAASSREKDPPFPKPPKPPVAASALEGNSKSGGSSDHRSGGNSSGKSGAAPPVSAEGSAHRQDTSDSPIRNDSLQRLARQLSAAGKQATQCDSPKRVQSAQSAAGKQATKCDSPKRAQSAQEVWKSDLDPTKVASEKNSSLNASPTQANGTSRLEVSNGRKTSAEDRESLYQQMEELSQKLHKTIRKYPSTGKTLFSSSKSREFAVQMRSAQAKGQPALCYWEGHNEYSDDKEPLGTIPISTITAVEWKSDEDKIRVVTNTKDQKDAYLVFVLKFATAKEAKGWSKSLLSLVETFKRWRSCASATGTAAS